MKSYRLGLSLRGMIWTGPVGYALYQLGYGWQYALSGSTLAFLVVLFRAVTWDLFLSSQTQL